MRTWIWAIAIFALTCLAASSAWAAGAGQAQSPTVLSSAQPSATPSFDVAFDQIDRTIQGIATAPPMNHFDADVAAIARYQSAGFGMSSGEMNTMMAESIAQQIISAINPIAGLFTQAAQQAQANALRKRMEAQIEAMTGPNPGTLTHYAFYHGWARAEVAGFAVIIKPDVHEEIVINAAKKTFRRQSLSTPEPLAPDTSTSMEPNPTQATITVATTQSGDATVNGQATTEYTSDATIALANSEAPCKDGSFTASQTAYYANLAEPMTTAAANARLFYSLALPQYCNIALKPAWSGPALPDDRMYVYRLVKVIRDPTAAAKPPPSEAEIKQQNMVRTMFGSTLGPDLNYSVLSERSNIRQLTEADASLFEVPTGYTETP